MGDDVWREQDGRCFWCAAREATGRDHIIPEGWFPSPRPSLVTVPCCERCGASGDGGLDTAHALLIDRDDADQTPRQLPGDPGTRTLSKKQPRGLPKNAVAGLRSVAAELETHRFERAMQRIIRGLYYHHFGERLGNQVPVRFFELGGSRLDTHPLWTEANGHGAFGAVVSYAFTRFERNPSASVWLIDLYGGAWSVGLTDLEDLVATAGVARGSPRPLAS